MWPDLVPIALWTLGSTISGCTGFAPYTLLFGADPVDMGFPEYSQASDLLNEKEAFLEILDQIGMFRHLTIDVTDEYEKGLRKRIDEGANPTLLYDSDLVYMYDPLCAENRTSKFSDRYRGPFRIIRVIGDNLVKIISVETGKIIPHLVNVAKWNPIVARPVLAEDLVEDEPQKLGLNTANEHNVEYMKEGTPGHPHDTMAGEGTQPSESEAVVGGDDLTLDTRNGAGTSSVSPARKDCASRQSALTKPCSDDRQAPQKPCETDRHEAQKPCTIRRPSQDQESGRPDWAENKPSMHDPRILSRHAARRGRPPTTNATGTAVKTPMNMIPVPTKSAPKNSLFKQAAPHDSLVTKVPIYKNMQEIITMIIGVTRFLE